MRIQNVSSVGDLFIPAFGLTVLTGESVDVADDVAAVLLEQPDNWAVAAKPAETTLSTDA